MFVHTVFFYLKKDLTEDQRQKFFAGVDTLKTIEPHVKILTGTPASTDRPIIVKDYDYGLTCIFENIEDDQSLIETEEPETLVTDAQAAKMQRVFDKVHVAAKKDVDM